MECSLTQSKRRHIVVDSLPGALWRMIGLVHDPHVRKLLLTVGILAQTVDRRSCECLKALEILPIRNPEGGNPLTVRNIVQGGGSPEILVETKFIRID